MSDGDAIPGHEVVDLGVPGVVNATKIGQGGFATVYRAEQPAYRRQVAVKVLSAEHVDDQARTRFTRECAALGSLSEHPNIVTLYESGFTDAGRPYLIMAYTPGGSLQDRIHNTGPLGWEESLAVGVKLCGALESAHRVGVLHRDIKPANVLISRYGEPMLADFGIARLAGGVETTAGGVSMSIAYAPPEVLAGERPAPTADVYSLASMLFTLLAGTPAFVRETDESFLPIYSRIVSEDPPDLRAMGVPAVVAHAVESGMSKRTDERPGTALELGEMLAEAQRALSVPVSHMVVESQPGVVGGTRGTGDWATGPGGVHGTSPPAPPTPGTTTGPPPPPTARPGDATTVLGTGDGHAAGAGAAAAAGAVAGAAAAAAVSGDVAAAARPGDQGGGPGSGAAPPAGAPPVGRGPAAPAPTPAPRKKVPVAVFALAGAVVAALVVVGVIALGGGGGDDDDEAGVVTDTSAGTTDSSGAGTASTDSTVAATDPTTDPTAGTTAPTTDGTVETTVTPSTDGPVTEPMQVPRADEPLSDDLLALTTVRNGVWEISVLDTTNGDVTTLTRNAAGQSKLPALSPDRRTIAYTWARDVGAELWLVTVDGAATIRIAQSLDSDGRATWSPDGERIAFVQIRESGAKDLMILDLTTGETTAVTDDLATEGDPAWSPDGERIAFWKSGTGANGDLWVYDVASGEFEQLTTDPDFDADPDWSPDGERIVFSRQPGGHWSLWLWEDGEETQLTQTDDEQGIDDQTPTWAPDGERIAFESHGRVFVEGAPDETDLYVRLPDGTIEELLAGPGLELHASW